MFVLGIVMERRSNFVNGLIVFYHLFCWGDGEIIQPRTSKQMPNTTRPTTLLIKNPAVVNAINEARNSNIGNACLNCSSLSNLSPHLVLCYFCLYYIYVQHAPFFRLKANIHQEIVSFFTAHSRKWVFLG